jgi:integrase
MSGEGSVYQRSGDGRWCAALSVPGKPRIVLYAKTKREVLEKRREAERRLEQGLPATDKAVTVEQLFDEWLESVRLRRSAGTLRYYKQIVANHILPEVGKWKVSALQPKDVDRLVAKAADAGLSSSTVGRVRSVLVSALKFGISRRYCSRNVTSETEGVPQAFKEGRTLTPEQARRLLDAFRTNERWGAAFTTMLGLGLRRGEVLRLQWRDIDLDRGSLTVRGQVKTRASVRTVDLPSFVLDALKAHRDKQVVRSLDGSDFVFPNTIGKSQSGSYFYEAFVKLATETLGERWHPHEARHTAASLMLASGVPLEVVSKVLGHSKVSVTASIYAHLLPGAYQQAAQRMDAMLTGEVRR